MTEKPPGARLLAGGWRPVSRNKDFVFEPAVFADMPGARITREAPFGGTNPSGMGREGGWRAIQDYLDVKPTHFMAHQM